jgi:hypothetical protein
MLVPGWQYYGMCAAPRAPLQALSIAEDMLGCLIM